MRVKKTWKDVDCYLFSFFVSWILFAVVWFVFLLLKCVMFLFRYLISYVHGDFEYYQTDEDERVRFHKTHKVWNFSPEQNHHFQDEKFGDFKPCVFAMEEGWASSFLMSVETQHTIGWDENKILKFWEISQNLSSKEVSHYLRTYFVSAMVQFRLRISNHSLSPRYGFRGTSARCELALILECVQSVVGVIIQVKNIRVRFPK